jgi:hypothetical protein
LFCACRRPGDLQERPDGEPTPLRLPRVTSGYEPSPDDLNLKQYNVNEDFSQANNLAATNPQKLKEDRLRALIPVIRPNLTRGRNEFTYYPGMIRIPEGSAPSFKNKFSTVAAEMTVPDQAPSGVPATIGLPGLSQVVVDPIAVERAPMTGGVVPRSNAFRTCHWVPVSSVS